MVDNEISRAFRVWTSVIPINIIKKNSNSLKDVNIILHLPRKNNLYILNNEIEEIY